MELQNRDLIIANLEKLNRGEVTASVEDFAENVNNHEMKVEREVIAMILNDIYRTFPDWRFEIEDLATDGDSVIVRTKIRGTHLGIGQLPVNGGMLIGVEPTGKTFEARHIHWFKLRDGKIVEHHATRDDISMMQQLGLLPSAVEAN